MTFNGMHAVTTLPTRICCFIGESGGVDCVHTKPKRHKPEQILFKWNLSGSLFSQCLTCIACTRNWWKISIMRKMSSVTLCQWCGTITHIAYIVYTSKYIELKRLNNEFWHCEDVIKSALLSSRWKNCWCLQYRALAWINVSCVDGYSVPALWLTSFATIEPMFSIEQRTAYKYTD